MSTPEIRIKLENGGPIRLFLVFGLVTTTLWVAFANLVVPPIINAAYHGESYPFLNAMIRGQSVHPVVFYQQVWGRITMRVLVSCAMFSLLAIIMSTERFFSRCVGNATPGTLGAIRMWTCVILLMTTLWDDLGGIGLLPLQYHVDMGLMRVLHSLPIGFDRFLTSPASLTLFQRLTEVLLILGIVGWRTRVVIPLCAVCTFVMNGILREYSFFWHQNLVPIYVLMVLSFTPCGDGWSIDRLRRIYQGRAVPDADVASAIYGWARYACWVPIALTYTSGGLSKLRASGLGWMSATNMRALLYEQTLYPRAGNMSVSLHLAPAPDIVFTFLAVAALCSEALFFTVLFSRIARRILPAVGMLMHVGIVFLMNIVFFDLTLLLFIFYDFGWAPRRIGDWVRRARPIQVLYDGLCPFCRRTVGVLRSLDLFRRLEFQDFRSLEIEELNRKHSAGLTTAALENEMFVIAGGRAYGGFDAYRALSLALPPAWPVAPWLFIPGAATLGNSIYRYVARHRLALVTCDSGCAAQNAPDGTLMARQPGRFVGWCRIAASAVIASQGFFWLNGIEFYPFTSVQMFTRQPGTVVTYYKTLGHWESGRVSQIYLEDTLGVMSVNSRYEALFDICFDAQRMALCRETISILGSAYNAKASAGDRLTQIEIQRWKWDFGSNPGDSGHGSEDARFVGDVASARAKQVWSSVTR